MSISMGFITSNIPVVRELFFENLISSIFEDPLLSSSTVTKQKPFEEKPMWEKSDNIPSLEGIDLQYEIFNDFEVCFYFFFFFFFFVLKKIKKLKN